MHVEFEFAEDVELSQDERHLIRLLRQWLDSHPPPWEREFRYRFACELEAYVIKKSEKGGLRLLFRAFFGHDKPPETLALVISLNDKCFENGRLKPAILQAAEKQFRRKFAQHS